MSFILITIINTKVQIKKIILEAYSIDLIFKIKQLLLIHNCNSSICLKTFLIKIRPEAS